MSAVSGWLRSERAMWVEKMGIAALLAFAAFAWSSTSLSALALAGLVLAYLLHPDALPRLRRDPVFMVFIVACSYLLVRTVWASLELPVTAADQRQQAWSWFRLWFFIPVAWWLGAQLERINLVLLLALASLVGAVALHLDWSRFPEVLFETGRQTFHRHPNPFALYVATALLGLLLFAPAGGVPGVPPSHSWHAASCGGWSSCFLSSGCLLPSRVEPGSPCSSSSRSPSLPG